MSARTNSGITAGMALLPVRLFLGVTFVYAGYQKLSDPGFLTPGAATYIGTQLHAFASGTPGGFLLRWFALPFPRAAGVGVALAEIAIGLLTTVGLLTRPAAAAGLGLNLVLFLTASWSTTPYFLGSDIVFCFAWLPLALVGAADQPAVDTLVLNRRVPAQRAGRTTRSGAHVYGAAAPDPHTRRTLLRRALVLTGAGTLSIAALATAMRGSVRPAPALSALGSSHRRPKSPAKHHRKPPTSTGGTGHTTAQPKPGAQVPAGAVRLGPSSGPADGCGGDLPRPRRRLSGHRRAPRQRGARGVQRRLHPRRLRGRLPVGRDLLPLPRVRVRPRHRRGPARAGRHPARSASA